MILWNMQHTVEELDYDFVEELDFNRIDLGPNF